jgi:ribA/ribD-fused uncharacterized protein
MIKEFQGEFRWASNFYLVDIKWQGKIWPSTEHIYQAMKTKDKELQEKMRLCSTPGKAKRLGAQLKLRPLWDELKFAFMYTIVNEKFKQNSDLRQRLFDTGNQELQEGNHWDDVYWGICNGVGINCLGRILMEIRTDLAVTMGKQLELRQVD